jgi:hypothetical protein
MKGSIGKSTQIKATKQSVREFYRKGRVAHENRTRIPGVLNSSTMPAQIVVIAPKPKEGKCSQNQ